MAATSPTVSAHLRELWGMRLFFFLLTGGAAILMPFLPLFYRQHGLSGTQIGVLGTVTSVGLLVAAPVWGRLNDRASRPRLVLQAALGLAALCLLWLSRQTAFAGFIVVVAVYSLLNAGIEPISNRLALQVVDRAGKGGFGSIRLWGSLGWAVIVLISGGLVEYAGSLMIAFLGAFVFTLVSILILYLVRIEPSAAAPAGAVPQEGTRQVLRRLLSSRLMLGLGMALVIQWFVLNGLYQFQAIYLEQLGAGEALIGASWMVSAVVELPGMWWADQLIKRYGARTILALAFLLEAARTLPVLAWPSITSIIAAEVITGLAYSFLWIGMVVYINETAPGKSATTMMALYTVTLPAVTQMAGGPFSGMVFDRFGAYWLYGIALVGSLAAFLVLRLITARRGISLDS